MSRPAPSPRRGGPRGCVLGGIAILLLAALAIAAIWTLSLRPYLRGVVSDRLRENISAELAAIDQLPVPPEGELIISEADLNARLRATAGAYAPLSDPRVAITRAGVRLSFSLYGSDNTFAGLPIVNDGRVILRDATLAGPAAQLLAVEDAAGLFEEQLATLFERSGLRPTAVAVRDGTLTVSTAAMG